MYQASPQQAEREPFHLSSKVAHKATGSDLGQHLSVHKSCQKVGIPLDCLDALRVRQHGLESLELELKKDIIEVVGVPVEGHLHQSVPGAVHRERLSAGKLSRQLEIEVVFHAQDDLQLDAELFKL